MNSKKITKKSSSSFGWAFFCLSRQQRNALYALYAFCRIVDDIVDEAQDVEKAQKELNHWREMLERINHPSVYDHQVINDLSFAVKTFDIQLSDLYWIIDGVERDLYQKRYETFDELLEYCDAVASAVGFASLAIFGVDRKKYEKYAYATGRALQLTNIIRDVGFDAGINRIYLPQEDLKKFECREKDIRLGVYTEAFEKLMAFEAERTWEFYSKAQSHIDPNDAHFLAPAEVMRRTYRLLLKRIQNRNFRVFSKKKIRISKSRKAAIAFSIMVPRLLKAA